MPVGGVQVVRHGREGSLPTRSRPLSEDVAAGERRDAQTAFRAGPRRPAPAGAKLLGQVRRWMVDEDDRTLRDAFEQEAIPAYLSAAVGDWGGAGIG